MEFKQKKSFTYIWRIENFSHCLHKENEILESPVFALRSLHESRWCIEVYPGGLNGDLAFHIVNVTAENTAFPFRYQTSILDIDGTLVNPEKENFEHFIYNMGIGTTPYPSLKEVCETKRSTYLPQDTLTLIGRLWDRIGDMEEDVQCVARTKIGVKKLSRPWCIKNFNNDIMSNLTNSRLLINDCSISMILNLSLEASFLGDWIRIEINPDKCTKKSSIWCKISLLDRFGKSVKEMQDKHKFTPDEDHTWNFPSFISKRELIEKNDLWFNDVLYLHCEFTISFGDIVYNEIEGSPVEFLFPLGNSIDKTNDFLKADFLSLYQENTLSDFELKSEGVQFPVHKAILCARSPVFKAMLTSNMREGDSKSLDVPDVDADTLSKLLLYAYSGTIDQMDLESTSKLYYAADKYQIVSLRQKCISELKSNLTVSKLIMILELADRHQDGNLMSAVHDFILDHGEEVMQSAEWIEFEKSYSRLVAKTMCQIFRKRLQLRPDY